MVRYWGVDQVVEVVGEAREQHHLPVLVAPIHGDPHGESRPRLAAVRGVGDLSGGGVHVVPLDLQLPDAVLRHADAVYVHGAVVVDYLEEFAAHPLVGLLLSVADHPYRPGARQVRYDVATREDHGPRRERPQGILQAHLEVREQIRILESHVEHAGQGADLPGEIVDVNLRQAVQGGVDDEAGIVDGDEGQSRGAGGQHHLAVDGDLAGNE